MKDLLGLQLEFDLPGLDEAEGDAREREVSWHAAREISEAARAQLQAQLDGGDLPEWAEDYVTLLQRGWPWRVACYMAWASAPKRMRKPETVEKLATEVLGLRSARVIYQWRKEYPAIDTVIGMLQASVLWEHRADVLRTLAEMAMQPDYKAHNDRRVFLEMVGDYKPRTGVGLGAEGEDGELLPIGKLVAALREVDKREEVNEAQPANIETQRSEEKSEEAKEELKGGTTDNADEYAGAAG